MITSCSPSNEKAEMDNQSDTTQSMSEEGTVSFNEMSVFQLPSEWEIQTGETIRLEDLQGNVLVAVMIYTSCKAACPRLVADMKAIREKVGDRSVVPVKYLLFSIDPEVDTPERMRSFSEENEMTGDEWIFLRSSEENTREFANVLAVKYAEISPLDFSHSNIISVFDAEGVMQHQQEGLGVDDSETVAKIRELAGISGQQP